MYSGSSSADREEKADKKRQKGCIRKDSPSAGKTPAEPPTRKIPLRERLFGKPVDKKKKQDRISKDSPSTTKTATEKPISEKPSGDSTDIPAAATRAAKGKKKIYKKKQQDWIPKDSPSTTKTATEKPISEKPSEKHLLKKPVETKTVLNSDGEQSSISSALNISEGDLIPSPTTHYVAQKYLGNGAYGMVTQCRNVTTGETVALKIIESLWDIDYAQVEEVILQNMKKLSSDRFNIVRFYESFFYKEHYCLVFELLDMDLQKFKQISPGQHLQLKQIRPILQQLATALDFLNIAGIIHADLKPDNIMLVDHVRQPLKVKVIDFGLSFDDPEEMLGQTLQTLWYRAPEILSLDSFSGKIDVWSLGCIAAELSMGTPLFRAKDEEDLVSICT
ncbi:homeodomain-interacting protein kinase 1-like [Platichthys flesus]|uniref:homeodomain-interacting protein kinase 1-like n=1 Tax=Platichthys flesus TaxID=8260 RepID=UPI002DB5D292|nr:homeodomain-interacting protein kinase 1-like [Platichthys flesus]